MKKFVCMLLTLALLAACAVGAVAEEEKITVGLSLNLQDEINVKFQEVYEQLINEKYTNVDLIVTNALGDTSRQLSDIESLIMQDCDCLLYTSDAADD